MSASRDDGRALWQSASLRQGDFPKQAILTPTEGGVCVFVYILIIPCLENYSRFPIVA